MVRQNMRRLTFVFLFALVSVSAAAAQQVPSSNFNGGRTQLNLNFVQTAGDYGFINALKSAQTWSYVKSTGPNCSSGAPAPSELNLNGYPLAESNGITHCGGLQTLFYIPSTNELAGDYIIDWSGHCTLGIANSYTTVSGSHTSSPWRIRFDSNKTRIPFAILGTDGTCDNIRFYNINHQAALNSGKVFTPYFEQILRNGKVGTLRFENWTGNFSQLTNITQWSHNKPTSYVYYWGNELRSSLYAGTTTNNGNAYLVTCSSPCTAETEAPRDKDLILLQFNASATSNSPVTLNLNATGAVSVTDMCACGNEYGLWRTEYPVANKYAALVYDAGLNVWLKYGGDLVGNAGISNGVPPQIILQLCNEIGSHCWINAPYLSLDPDQGYVTALAQLAQQVLQFGIKLIIEPPDETWNSVYPWTNYARLKSTVNWNANDVNQEYGMWLAEIGKDVSSVYDGDTTKYSVVGCEWTTLGPIGTTSTRFTSAQFVAHGGWAAAKYATHLCIAGYWTPAEYETAQEIVDAYNYVTADSSLTRNAIATNFVNTGANSFGMNQRFTLPTINDLYRKWAAVIRDFDTTYGANMHFDQYEGGYSPDFDRGNNATLASRNAATITGISSASSAVLTLGNDSFSNAMSAAAGMSVTVAEVNPWTFNGTFTVQSVGAGSNTNKVTINLDSSALAYVSGGTMTYNGVSASISGVMNTWPCAYALSSPIAIWPGFSVAVSGATGTHASQYNVSQRVVSIDSTGKNVTTTLNCTSLGSTGGSSVMSATMASAVNTLREAGKFTSAAATLTTTNFNNFAAQSPAGEFPSMFVFSGWGWSGVAPGATAAPSAWPVFDFDIYQTPSPQWNAIVNYNAGSYPYLLKRDLYPATNDNSPVWLNGAA